MINYSLFQMGLFSRSWLFAFDLFIITLILISLLLLF